MKPEGWKGRYLLKKRILSLGKRMGTREILSLERWKKKGPVGWLH